MKTDSVGGAAGRPACGRGVTWPHSVASVRGAGRRCARAARGRIRKAAPLVALLSFAFADTGVLSRGVLALEAVLRGLHGFRRRAAGYF